MTTWDEAFASRYDEWSAHMTEDVAFYVGLAREADGPLVELAVGNGRVAIPVAQAMGRPVLGIDSSPGMLEQAHANAAAAGVELVLQEGDMRDLALDEPAALVYCPFRALLHLPTWADRRRVFERVAASLRPGGRFAWNAFAFDHKIAARLDGVHQDEPIPHHIEYGVGDNRIDILLDDGGRSSLWWATKNEWLGLIDVAGLELEALYGGFARRAVHRRELRVRVRCPPADRGHPRLDMATFGRRRRTSPLTRGGRGIVRGHRVQHLVGLPVVLLGFEEEDDECLVGRSVVQQHELACRESLRRPAALHLTVLLVQPLPRHAFELDNTCKCHLVPPLSRCALHRPSRTDNVTPSHSIARWCCSGSPPRRRSRSPARSSGTSRRRCG